VADDNVLRWQNDPKRTLDVAYLQSLGASAWPALITVAETSGRPEAHTAFRAVEELRNAQLRSLEDGNWRSWQWRTQANGRKLLNQESR
jgi:hypothetical protein